MSKITKVHARQVFDSRGNPTIEAEITLENNIKAFSIVPSGASTGAFEAHELRDNDKDYFLGKSVLKAVNNVNTIISQKIINQDPTNQKKIDDILLNLDGTDNKKNLGANSLLAVSLAVRKAAIILNKENYSNFKKDVSLPYPLMNIINGGAHADNDLNIQEFMIRPDSAKNFMDAIESYNKSLSVQPNDKETLYLLGNALLDAGHHREGLKYQREARGVIEFSINETDEYEIVGKATRNKNDD